MKQQIKIIALDLDGTLLNSNKELTPENESALRRAAEAGIEIVPTTGRLHNAIPDVIRDLPYINYVISVNGAEVYDLRRDYVVSKAEIPWQQAIEIMTYLDTLPTIYDCYMDNAAWMTARMKDEIDNFAPNEQYRKMLIELRQPVDELKAFLAQRQHDIQKTQFFLNDPDLRKRLLTELNDRFDNVAVSSSVDKNIEINHKDANKGTALLSLAEYLGVPAECTMSFGDGLNDLPMILAAGIGVAMENADDDIKAQADVIAPDCDSNGVAAVIEQYCL